MHLAVAAFSTGVTLLYQERFTSKLLDYWEDAYHREDKKAQREFVRFFTLRDFFGIIPILLLFYGVYQLFLQSDVIKPAVQWLVLNVIIPLSEFAYGLPVVEWIDGLF